MSSTPPRNPGDPCPRDERGIARKAGLVWEPEYEQPTPPLTTPIMGGEIARLRSENAELAAAVVLHVERIRELQEIDARRRKMIVLMDNRIEEDLDLFERLREVEAENKRLREESEAKDRLMADHRVRARGYKQALAQQAGDAAASQPHVPLTGPIDESQVF